MWRVFIICAELIGAMLSKEARHSLAVTSRIVVMQKLKSFWHYILARLEEPSTYAGGSVLATIVAAIFPGHLGTAILAAMAAIGAVLAIVIPEKKIVIESATIVPSTVRTVAIPESATVINVPLEDMAEIREAAKK